MSDQPGSAAPPTLCEKHTQCIAGNGHDGPCLVPAWAEVWQRDARCDCCDLPVESCGKAVEQKARQEDANARLRAMNTPGATFAAFPGLCCRCQEPIKIGDPIRWDSTHHDGWLRYCCF